jgi:hypothetical protein
MESRGSQNSFHQAISRGLTVLSGFMYFTPVAASLAVHALGHWLHVVLAQFHMQWNKRHFVSEAHLVIAWLAMPFVM